MLGRDFISKFSLQLCSVPCNQIKSVDLGTYLQGKYAQLFTDELGTFNKHKVTLKIKPDAQLKFFKPRPVPLALKQKVENELHRLMELGIIEKVEHSEVATPIVPVLRPDGNIRICGDYSVTLNKWLYTDSYPLPRIQDLFAKLHGGVQFSKLDLSRAYNQLLLDDTKKLTCINTHKGLFCFNRLVFGLSTAPSIFQRILEEVLTGIDGVCIFLDDILITAENQQRHLLRLEEVLSRLENSGFRVKENKCELFKDSVEYLGFIIDKNGLRKSNSKVEAILTSESPKNVSELKSFLGMVNYYRSFVRGASSLMAPLHLLLKKGIKWNWGKDQAQVFNKIKRELASERTLAHYNPELPTIVTADAGPRGLGAVLSHRYPDGTERVVAYASRSLTKAECNYSQIQKEAAAIVFSIKKFHHYVYGRVVPFTLRTDHKPLLTIFGSKKGIPEIAANRLQRYALFLSAYNFNLEYVKSEQNVADYLSRSVAEYIKRSNEVLENDDKSMFVNHITDSILKPITLDEIKRETERDETLRKIIGFVKNGWPKKVADLRIKPFYACRCDLSYENGCLLRGYKLVIPSFFREQILDMLHIPHFGVVKTKTEARSRFWWPNIDKHIEEKVGSCTKCNSLRSNPPRAPLTVWPYPARPWERVHLDMFTLIGKQFLIAVDAHSKWVECFPMTNTDSEAIISKLSEMFSRFGIVRTLVTDNGRNFCSSQFDKYCLTNGIQHLTTAPYHPASNGQAENTVKTVKRGLKIMLNDKSNPKLIQRQLNEFLFNYRNSKHCTTGFSPAQLLFGRSLRCRLDLLRVSDAHSRGMSHTNNASAVSLASAAKNNVVQKQTLQHKQYGGSRKSEWFCNDEVLIKHFYNNGTKHIWLHGVVRHKIGKRLYGIYVPVLKTVLKKHLDHIVSYKGTKSQPPELEDVGDFIQLASVFDPPDTLAESDTTAKVDLEEEESDSSFCSVPETPSSVPLNDEQQTVQPSNKSSEEEDEQDGGRIESIPSELDIQPVSTAPQSTYQRPVRAVRKKIVNYKF